MQENIISFSGKKSLYQFAGAIVKSFNFFFDHCFEFYGEVNEDYLNIKKFMNCLWILVRSQQHPMREG